MKRIVEPKRMTTQEAIKLLQEKAAASLKLIREMECRKVFLTTTDECKESVEAFNLAIAALKKQIPEQVSGNVDYYTCKCGAIVPPMERYCQDCGQRLKWREE